MSKAYDVLMVEAGRMNKPQTTAIWNYADELRERLRALAAELAESTRHRDQNRETAVALQMRVSALEAALRKYGIELVEWTSGVWTYNCRACDHGNGTTFLPTDIEHDPACELMALLKDTAPETRDVAGDPIAGMYVRAEMRCRILERAMNLYMDETTAGSPYGEKGLKGVLADREMWTEHFRHAMGLPIQAKTTTDHCHWDDDPDEGFKYFWRTACGNHGSRMGYQFMPPMCPHCERPIDNWSAPTSANRDCDAKS